MGDPSMMPSIVFFPKQFFLPVSSLLEPFSFLPGGAVFFLPYRQKTCWSYHDDDEQQGAEKGVEKSFSQRGDSFAVGSNNQHRPFLIAGLNGIIGDDAPLFYFITLEDNRFKVIAVLGWKHRCLFIRFLRNFFISFPTKAQRGWTSIFCCSSISHNSPSSSSAGRCRYLCKTAERENEISNAPLNSPFGFRRDTTKPDICRVSALNRASRKHPSETRQITLLLFTEHIKMLGYIDRRHNVFRDKRYPFPAGIKHDNRIKSVFPPGRQHFIITIQFLFINCQIGMEAGE